MEKVVLTKGRNERKSLRRLKPTVGCNASKIIMIIIIIII